jgi:hypothetical protein
MTSTSAQFATMEACEAARAQLVQQLTADNPGAW